MEAVELLSFQIIAEVGSARSYFIEAIHAAKKGNFEAAAERMAQGEHHFTQGHHHHTEMIQQEASGVPVPMSILLTHAQDQLMSAETFKILAAELIDLYKKINLG
jgi:PTS system cellobiose-specific IIA component